MITLNQNQICFEDWSKISLLDMIDVWENYGWSFQSALWKALKHADWENQQKIIKNRNDMIKRDYLNGLYDEYLIEC